MSVQEVRMVRPLLSCAFALLVPLSVEAQPWRLFNDLETRMEVHPVRARLMPSGGELLFTSVSCSIDGRLTLSFEGGATIPPSAMAADGQAWVVDLQLYFDSAPAVPARALRAFSHQGWLQF